MPLSNPPIGNEPTKGIDTLKDEGILLTLGDTRFEEPTIPEWMVGEVDTVDNPTAIGFQDFSIFGGLIKGNDQIKADLLKQPPGWNLSEYMERNPERATLAAPFMADSKNPFNATFLSLLGEAYNDGMVDVAFDRLERTQKALKAWEESPWSTGVGVAAGIGTDIVATIGMALLTKGPGPIGGTLLNLQRASSLFASGTSVANRTVAGARVGALGSLEGFIDGVIQQDADPFVTDSDVAFQTALGFLIGGGLGAAFPRRIGGFANVDLKTPRGGNMEDAMVELQAIRDAARKASDTTAEDAGDAGAQKAPESPEAARERLRSAEEQHVAEVEKGSHTLLAGRLPGIKNNRFLRNPKNWWADLSARGRKRREKGGFIGATMAADLGLRLFRSSRIQRQLNSETLEEVGTEIDGAGTRARTVEDFADMWNTHRGARITAVDNEFEDALDAIYGVPDSVIGRVLRRTAAESEILATARRQARGQDATGSTISKSDYEAVADEIAQLKAHNKALEDIPVEARERRRLRIVDITEAIPAKIRGMLDEDQLKALLEKAEKTAAADDEFWNKYQRGLIDNGLLDAEDVIHGYRPQIWNIRAIDSDQAGFKAMLIQVFGADPEPAWVNAHFKHTDDAGNPATLWEEGESWADVVAKDPELSDEVFEAWSDGVRRELEDRKFQATQDAELKLAKEHAKTYDELRARFNEEIDVDRGKIERWERWIEQGEEGKSKTKFPWPERRAKLEGAIKSAEIRITQTRKKLSDLEEAIDARETMAEFIKKHANNKARKSAKKARKGLEHAQKQEASLQAKKFLRDAVDDVVAKIANGSASGRVSELAGDKFRVGGSRLLSRQIHLGEWRFDERMRKFLNRDSTQIRDAYTQAVGNRIALRQALKPILEREGVELTGEADDRLKVTTAALSGYDVDLAKLKGSDKESRKLYKELTRERAQVKQIINHTLDIWEGVIQRNQNKLNMAPATEVALGATAMSSLGSMLIQQISDLSVLILAGSKSTTGFVSLLKSKRIKKIFKEIAKNDPQTAALYMGMLNIDNMRWRGLAGTAEEEAFLHGSHVSVYQKLVRELGHYQAMATFGNYWNRMVRGAFGHDFIRQMKEDLANWENLKPRQRTFYARVGGINDIYAKEMTEMWNRAETRYGPPGKPDILSTPDRKAWSIERPDLMEKFDMLVSAAGREAVMAPGIMDMPFLGRTNAGKLIQQFTGFMFTAGEKVIPRMTQTLVVHPKTPALYLSAFSGVIFGAFVDFVKHVYHGKDPDEWFERDTPELIWGAAARSPFLAGMSGTLYENFFTQFGEGINETIGMQVLPQSATKFKRQQGLWSLAGPLAGNANHLYKTTGTLVDDGDYEKYLDQNARLIPIINTIGIRLTVDALDALIEGE